MFNCPLSLAILIIERPLSLTDIYITDVERLLDMLSRQLPALTYLSLLGNPACPDQLSCMDSSDEDYEQHR